MGVVYHSHFPTILTGLVLEGLVLRLLVILSVCVWGGGGYDKNRGITSDSDKRWGFSKSKNHVVLSFIVLSPEGIDEVI